MLRKIRNYLESRSEERELLHKQLELLAEQSKKCRFIDNELQSMSGSMNEIYKSLKIEIGSILFQFCMLIIVYSIMNILVLIKKLLRSKT